jgi:hypothetical protein
MDSMDPSNFAQSGPTRHPSVENLLQYFAYDHLPEHLVVISRPFSELAHKLTDDFQLEGPEAAVALRKLLEAKDCAVRAALHPPL